jgi:hypothetical protein
MMTADPGGCSLFIKRAPAGIGRDHFREEEPAETGKAGIGLQTRM